MKEHGELKGVKRVKDPNMEKKYKKGIEQWGKGGGELGKWRFHLQESFLEEVGYKHQQEVG